MKTMFDQTYNCGQGLRWRIIIILLCLTLFTPNSRAHEGPPFPIIVDEEVGPYLVSVWTDPDIGIGTFFVVFDPVSGGELSEISSVRVGVEPVSGRLEEEVYDAESQSVRNGARYFAEVAFDQGEMWRVHIYIEGRGWSGELHSEVEATPDGSIGPIGLLIYFLPFVCIGALWIRAMLIRQRQDRN